MARKNDGRIDVRCPPTRLKAIPESGALPSAVSDPIPLRPLGQSGGGVSGGEYPGLIFHNAPILLVDRTSTGGREGPMSSSGVPNLDRRASEEPSSTSMLRSPIVIIGGGIGGLTLGRCLHRYGVPFRIYDQSPGSSRHNYGITLQLRSCEHLSEVIRTPVRELRRALAVDRAYEDNRTGIPCPDQSSSLRANRFALETLLSRPVEEHIKHSQKVTGIKLSTGSGNLVELTLNDAKKIMSSVVVDCSGVHSLIRAALLPQTKPEVHPFVTINGKRYISQDTFDQVYEPHLGDSNVLTRTLEFKHAIQTVHARLEVGINDHDPLKKRVSISYVYSRQAFPEKDHLYLPNRPKDAAKDIPEEFFAELESLAKSRKLTPAFADAFSPSQARQDRLLHWLLRSVHVEDADLAKLREQGVLMIGDAAYAEPIIGSEPGGANHVIAQATRLAEKLAVNWKSEKKLADLDIPGYLDPEPKSRREDVAAHLESVHIIEPAKAAL